MALLEGCKHEIELVVPVEEIDTETALVVEDIRKKAALPGFRPGKVPASLIRTKISRSERATRSSRAAPVPIPLHMKRRERSAPIWLFSFVDLAFLLLIAFTQLAPDPAEIRVAVAELERPRIERVEAGATPRSGEPVWQLRVHPLAGSDDPTVKRAPFELIEPGTADDPEARRAVDASELAAHLEVLRDRALPRPLLAPHRDARSEDLLVAVSLLEGAWQNGRGVTVQPIPAISAKAGPQTGELETR